LPLKAGVGKAQQLSERSRRPGIELLQEDWVNLAIVKIERIEIQDSGWEASYRE
jgi:hypothetical protein